jgi:hypothetical protein
MSPYDRYNPLTAGGGVRPGSKDRGSFVDLNHNRTNTQDRGQSQNRCIYLRISPCYYVGNPYILTKRQACWGGLCVLLMFFSP